MWLSLVVPLLLLRHAVARPLANFPSRGLVFAGDEPAVETVTLRFLLLAGVGHEQVGAVGPVKSGGCGGRIGSRDGGTMRVDVGVAEDADAVAGRLDEVP